MAEYVTLVEAAELEGVKYKTMAQRLSRNPDKFDTMTEKSETGGKDAVLVAVASLSKKARNAWKERAKLKELSGTISSEGEAQPEPEAPWYVEADVDWYIENYREQWYKGMELGNVIREFLQYDGANKTEYAEQYAQEHLGSGKRTLYRYVKAYNEACAWADKLQKESGVGFEFFKVLCLCRKPKESGTFPSIKPEVKQVIKNIWFNEDFAANLGTREMLYEKLTLVANVNKWEKIPSYQTVTRYITYLMEDEGMKNAHFLASKGSREYKNKVMVKGSRDTSGLKVMQIVMGDEHTFDCWVAYKQPNGKVIPIKPHLAAWVDMRSRAIMGDVLCKDANSDILKQSLLKMMYSEPGGIPEYLYIDNGKDYTAKTMTGRDRNDRSGMDFDDTTKGFYKSIGIKDDHRALPYEPWSKGQIERFFRTVCNKFTKWFKSYTGTLTGSKTSDKVTKDIKRMCENGELLTMEEFYEEWHKWLTEVYMHTEHGGLKKAKETHKTPYDCFMNEERYFKAAPPKSYATLLMMKSENVLVRNIGIVRWGFEYRSDELCDYIGRKMDIKYDPDDMSTLYVFDKNDRKVCEAYCQELLQVAPKVSQKALEEHLKMQKRQQKRDRERLEEARVPFEQINEQCDDTMACRDLVEAIEMELGMPRSTGGTIWSRVNRIREFFNVNQGYLLIIDEADKLINKYTQKKMEILRGIFDQSDVGIVIAGEPRLETELKSSLTRFANRMDFYYKLKGLNQNEVMDYLEGFDIDEAAMGELISRATNHNNGCFRLLDRTLNNVLRVLKERGESKVTLKIVSEASSMMML